MKKYLFLLPMFLLTACSMLFDYESGILRDRTFENVEVRKVEPQLSNPFKLAIYFVPHISGTYPSKYSNRPFKQLNWNLDDKKLVTEVVDELKKKGIVSEAVFILDNTTESVDFHSDINNTNRVITRVAERAGADAVLVLEGNGYIDRSNNILGVTYMLVAPMFIIPGTAADAYFVVSAAMWDVRSQYIHVSVESEGIASQTRPKFLVDEHKAIISAKTEAMKDIAGQLADQMGRLHSK